ncbi:rhomboid protein 2 [Histoplasma mississippiense (nom. inval.)]|uniref:rhomboid protein 2 n=1 Tax=Ajellomyces capsulatus (strain NAm1 / WU24) TaxID=2059318 RepID=UPI000157C54D|nr:rhomboid protein 2 [Histoplasma mississippiense (nom. inval.)]EDN08746.1 rhomboid protein 2 [Histoplasma mississippiense (nom. inval.)]
MAPLHPSRYSSDVPLSTLPAGLYLVFEKVILRGNTTALGSRIPTWTTPLLLIILVFALIPNTSLLGHLSGLAVGYIFGLGYLKFLVPPEKILRWIERKLNLLARLPHYVSVDQKTYGRYGILSSREFDQESGAINLPLGSTQRLGP